MQRSTKSRPGAQSVVPLLNLGGDEVAMAKSEDAGIQWSNSTGKVEQRYPVGGYPNKDTYRPVDLAPRSIHAP